MLAIPRIRFGQAVTTQGTRVTHYRYNGLGDLTEVEDPLGRVTQMQYDGAGRRIASINPALHRTDTEYDLNSNITVIRPPGRSEHRFLFDALDRVVKMLAPDLLSRPESLNSFNETMIYNEENEITQKKRMNANLIDWVYDQTKGLLTRISTSRGDDQFDLRSKRDNRLTKTSFRMAPNHEPNRQRRGRRSS